MNVNYLESSKILIEKINILKNEIEEIKKKHAKKCPFIKKYYIPVRQLNKEKEIEILMENLDLAFKIEKNLNI